MSISTVEDFKSYVAAVESRDGYQAPAAFAVGVAHYGISDVSKPDTWSENAKILDTYYPLVNCGENNGSAAILADAVGHLGGTQSYLLSADLVQKALACFAPFEGDGKVHANIEVLKQCEQLSAGTDKPQRVVVTFLQDLQDDITSVYDAYLRLHLLSHRKVKPHGIKLDGAFGVLNNVVWTEQGPFDPDNFELVRMHAQSQGRHIGVRSIDKFPRMTDYVIPSGVRIGDADRVRLGAHLADGTTIMHEGFVNFNAGTLGHSMVEGRISAGVVVGDGSDVGGGASIMGTLSGGGTEVISIGEKCLLGANAGIGISLGDTCTVEAGLYVTASSKVRCQWNDEVVKAKELSGQNDLLFRRNSVTGSIEVLRKRNEVELNQSLHSND